MATIVINTSNPQASKKIREIIRAYNVDYKELTSSQAEDIGLGLAMEQADKTKTVTWATLKKNLGR